jgi:alpha-glucosidase (family GH31 glycosyl hydrolase)
MYFNRHGEAPSMQFKDNFTSIWVKEANGIVLTRECWPGKSHWADFLNENTNKFWHYLMTPEFFNGTNSNYSYWIDMNEPSVFNIPGMTIPSDALHYTVNNKVY